MAKTGFERLVATNTEGSAHIRISRLEKVINEFEKASYGSNVAGIGSMFGIMANVGKTDPFYRERAAGAN